MYITPDRDLRINGDIVFKKDSPYKSPNYHIDWTTGVYNEMGELCNLNYWHQYFREVKDETKTNAVKTIEDIKAQLKADYDKAFNSALSMLEDIQRLQEKPKEYERWCPNDKQTYFYISGNNHIAQEVFNIGFAHNDRYNCFNIFKTKEEAEKERDIRQVWLELREFARRANARVRSNPKWVETQAYSAGLYGIRFLWTPDWREAQDKFGDRLKLLGEM